MNQADFLALWIAASDDAGNAYREVVDEWRPEDPPVTILFAALGYRIAETFDRTGADARRRVFSLIEQAMASDDPDLGTAVATGLIEALATHAAQSEPLWKRMAPWLGPLSKQHAEAWLFP